MAQIPLGNFGQVGVQTEVAQNRVITPDPGLQSRGSQQVASTLTNAAVGVINEQAQQDKALARVKASNVLLDRETQINTITSNLADQVKAGQLPYDKLEDAYNGAVSKLDPLTSPGLDEAEVASMGVANKRFEIGGMEKIRTITAAAKVDTARADLATRMDMLGKDAAMAGANIDQINARMDAPDIDVAGHMAFGEMWAAKKQQFRDDNWTTHATQRVVESRGGIAGLQQLEHDLTAADGFYAKKLDPDKRNQLLNTVTGRIYQIQEHNERQAEIRENKAERALAQMDRQAATGIPPTPADQQRWQGLVAGTSAAGEFKERVAQMNEVQGLLRQPIEAQQQYLDKKRQDMVTNGASVADQTNVARLQSAVDNNIKLMKTDPLSFSALRTGADVAPLDLSGLTTADGQRAIGEQLASRFDVVKAVQKKYGPEVSRVPFKEQELVSLRAGYTAADENTKLQILAAVGGAAPTGPDAAAAIKAIAPEQPVTLLAGMAQYQKLKAADGTDVAKTMMVGSKVLKDKSLPQPDDNLLQGAFDKAVGTAMPAGTPQREQAYEGFKALYAGLSDAAGTRYDPTNKVLDAKLTEKAVNMATGGVAQRGGGWGGPDSYKVIKPYGMEDTAFNAAVDGQLTALAASSKLPVDQLHDMPLSAVPGRDGSYYLLNAGRVQLDPTTNQPLVVKVK